MYGLMSQIGELQGKDALFQNSIDIQSLLIAVTEVKSFGIEISMKLRQSLTSSCFGVKMAVKNNCSLKFQCYFQTVWRRRDAGLHSYIHRTGVFFRIKMSPKDDMLFCGIIKSYKKVICNSEIIFKGHRKVMHYVEGNFLIKS
jgi:hypothetical protein